MLKEKIFGSLVGAALMAMAPAAVSELTDAVGLYACAEVTESDFTITPASDGTAVISAYTGKDAEVVIPATVSVDGAEYAVTGIGANTFKGKSSITKVVIPESVTSIGNYAFSGCTSLTEVTIPTNVSSLGTYVFQNCKKLTSVTIPTGISTIPAYAFYGCGLESVTIPDNVKKIDAFAFGNCANLVTVKVPDASASETYINIAATAFNNCAKLEFSYFQFELIVENGNASINGIIGQSADIVIPAKIAGYNVVTTSKKAFENKTFIENVVVPEGVRTLGEATFKGCKSLKSVTLPSTLSVISASTFEGCTSLIAAPLSDPNPGDGYDSEIVEIGNRAFYGCTGLVDVEFSANLNKIGANAFYGCTSIGKISMPNNITSIGENAFYGCTSLSDLKLSESLRVIPKGAFTKCSSLRSVTLPDDIYEISDGADNFGAFQLSGLESITFPAGMTKIGAFAFADCDALTEAKMQNRVTTLGKSCFDTCANLSAVTLSEGLTVIPERTFADCVSLESITFPRKLATIGDSGFSGCSALRAAELPEAIATIGPKAFSDCTSLAKVNLPDSITAIGDFAFRSTALTKVELPVNVKYVTLNKGVFSGCTNLAEVTVPENITAIADGAGASVADGTFYNCLSLEEIVLPQKLTKIGKDAFAQCKNLSLINFPASVASIGDYAFFDCRVLSDVKLGNGVKSIGAFAFEHCMALTEFEIPSSVTTVGQGAFGACENLTKLVTNANIVNKNASASASFYEVLFYSDSKLCLTLFYTDNQNLVNHALEEVVFNKGVTEIGDYSFGGARLLKRITISDTVTRIGKEAFYNCKALVFVNTIPNSVNEIADYAFSGCPNLKAMVIPSTVKTFGYKVFAGCTDLTIFGESGSVVETYVNNDNESVSFVNIYQNVQNAKADSTANAVSLTWDKISDSIVSNGQVYKIDKIVYHVYRTDSAGERVKLADVETNGYTDTAVTVGSTYTYSINCSYCFTAKNNEVYTIDSAELTIGKVTVAAVKVRNLNAQPGNGKVTLTWDKVAGATKYAVSSYADGKFTNVGATAANTYTVSGLTNGTRYGFLVRVYVNGAWSDYTMDDLVYATPEAGSIIPQNVKASAGDGKVTLTWDKVEGAANYAVFLRKGGTWLKIGTTGTGTAFTSRGLPNGGKYFYMIKSCVNGKWSGESAVVSAIPTCITPQNVKAFAGDGKVTLTWDAVKGASNYTIFLRKGSAWLKIGSSGANTTFTSRGLPNGGKYFYMVKAYVNGSWSDESAVVSAIPTSITPQNVKAAGGAGKAEISWDAVKGASNYAVFVKNGNSWKSLGSAGKATAYTAKGLAGGRYTFAVKAYVNGAWSDMSKAVTADVT